MSAIALATVAVAGMGCEREQRRFSEIAPASSRSEPLRMTPLQPGMATPPAPERYPYQDNAWAVSEGKRLYTWFNCVGCHAHGGGGMGPPLMDAQWIYGSEPENVFATIVEGRPNGMPAFGGKIADQQVWQLVAYVRSLSGLARKDVRAGRDDHMQVKQAEAVRTPETPRQSFVPPAAVGTQ